MTEWRPVVGYEGLYEVSNDGKVRSLPRRLRASRGGYYVRPPSTLQPNRVGPQRMYHAVHLYDLDHHRRAMRLHGVVLAAFVGPRPEGMIIRHLNGNSFDNQLRNLRYGTASENSHDMLRHGTHPQGSKTHCPRGHEYSPENTYRKPSAPNARRCWTCRRADAQRRST